MRRYVRFTLAGRIWMTISSYPRKSYAPVEFMHEINCGVHEISRRDNIIRLPGKPLITSKKKLQYADFKVYKKADNDDLFIVERFAFDPDTMFSVLKS